MKHKNTNLFKKYSASQDLEIFEFTPPILDLEENNITDIDNYENANPKPKKFTSKLLKRSRLYSKITSKSRFLRRVRHASKRTT